MEINTLEKNNICSTCHQPILPTYYFCPNCGAKLSSAPLSTTVATQIGIYLFSIILPSICFLFITRWPGLKYFKSQDLKTKIIGEVALTLLILSTIITFWLAYVWTQGAIDSINQALNMDLSAYGL
jgi:uncharacterized membrane-anchored protein